MWLVNIIKNIQWQGILSILAQGLQLLSGWQKDTQDKQKREDGKNEERVNQMHEVNSRKLSARSIIKRVREQEQDTSDK